MEEKDSFKTLDKIFLDLSNAKGYVLFAGVLTDELDDHGNNKIVFHYQRTKLGYEDAAKAVKRMKQHVYHDMEGRSGSEVS